MTTNHIERLDDALIRPGRVDRKVEFQLADKDTVTRLFRIVFTQSESDETVERLAADFIAKIPELEFSPAEILSLSVGI
jgi:mitochondrial chaperone BCS1